MTYPPGNQPPTGPQPGYPQQPYGQPQHPGYPPRPPKKKVWPWVLIAVPILLCGGCLGVIGLAKSGKDDASTSSVAAPAGGDAPRSSGRGKEIAPVGSAVRDGKFEFVVTAVDPPVKTIGTNQYLRSTAQGEYVVIHVDVSNIGNEARSYFGGNQKLFDEQGREFTNDTMAGINVNDQMSADINPGNRISAQIVFDVPPGTVPTTLEVHDSMMSGGAKVALR